MKKISVILPETEKNNNSSSKKIKRVAAYARVSSDKDEQLNSLENQKSYYQIYISNNPEWEFAGIYFDEGISGTSTKNRNGFNNMINDALERKIDMIIVKSISRFARNVVDALVTIRKLKAVGVGVYFEKEHINSLDPRDEFVLTMFSTIAQEESKSLSDNVKWAFRNNFKKGLYSVGYSTFLGYRSSSKYKMKIDKKQAKVVTTIYKLFLEGYSTSYIISYLEKRKIKTPSGKNKWLKNTILSILTNEKYEGNAILQKTYVADFLTHRTVKNTSLPKYYIENGHPAIVSHEVFALTQEKIEKLDRTQSKHRPLSGKIICEYCGCYYRVQKYTNRAYPISFMRWICRNRFNDKVRCNHSHFYEEQLYEYLKNFLFLIISSYKIISIILEVSSAIFDEDKIKSIKKYLTQKLSLKNESLNQITYRILLDNIVAHKDKSLTVTFIDGHTFTIKNTKWSPIEFLKKQK